MEKNPLKGFLTFLFLAIIMAFSQGAYAQTTVSGTVTDVEGLGIPGVSIVIEGTAQGTVTDIDGKYNLPLPEGASKLLFSYIGMLTQDIEVGSQTTIDVVMKADFIGVDEVVVVGYGTRTKEELTGAVSTVSADQLEATAESSVVSRLQGQVAGVTVQTSNRPGGDASILIRGLGTINNSGPLYVIDGVPASPGNNIAPGDIESISVLKDASSAAIYGTRGANGVVIITTKRGRVNQEPTIKFSLKSGIKKATNQYDMLNTREYADAVWLSFANRGVDPTHAQYGSGSSPVIPDYILPGGAMNGEVDESGYSYPGNVIFKANQEGTNWYDEIYQTGLYQEYDISVAGGGQKGTYAFSANYMDEEGILKYTNFKRYTARMNSDAKFNDWFKAGESIQLMYVDETGDFGDNGEGDAMANAFRAQPIIPVNDIGGNFAGSKAPEMGNSDNPVNQLYDAKDNSGKYMRILGNAFVELTPMKGLTIKSLFGVNWGQWNGKSYVLPTYEHSEPNTVNGVNVDSNYSLQWNWSNTINYRTTINDIHKFNVIVGTEAIENTWQSLGASRRVYFSEDPAYMQLDSGESNKENYGTGSEWSLFSIFGRVNYDLMGKYFFETTVRRDGSSRFGASDRHGTFPAASAAWAISEEGFMDNTDNWLDLLKVRLGWGMAGNDQIGNYNSFSTYSTNSYKSSYAINGSNTGATAGFMPSYVGNANVSWETTTTYNLGIDANMLDNHLAVSLDIWQRKTSDMLYKEPVPWVSGTATPPDINIGDMKNSGVDLEVAYNGASQSGDFTYGASLTLSHFKNEIETISTNPDLFIDAGSNRQKTYTRFGAGTAFPEFFGYQVEGIFQTQAEADAHPGYGDTDYNQPGHFKYKDVNGDGSITPDDRTFIGSPHPSVTSGLNLNLGYKNFDVSMFFYGSFGNELVNYTSRWRDYGMFNGGLSKDALYNSWGSPHLNGNNEAARLPMLDQSSISQEPSSAFVEDASYLRMKNLTVGYTIPKSLLDRWQVKNIRVYGQISNLFTITEYSGLDPEVRTSGSGAGLDRGAWPTPRQFMFGVTLGL